MPLTSVDCLLDTRESTDPVSEDAAAAVPLEFDADGGADEASWRMAGGGREVEAAKTGGESCFGTPSTIAGFEICTRRSLEVEERLSPII